MKFTLKPGQLKLSDIRLLLDENRILELDKSCFASIYAAEKVITDIIAANQVVYGVNTGFGALANTHINPADLENLQRSLVLSHAAGTGELLNDETVRLILALKINSLARGYSGVRMQTIDALIQLYNAKLYPCIPSQGSVGASGDLAPLAHMAAVLLGVGHVRYQGTIITAIEALAHIHLKPLQLAPKEGLALLNGTQVSTALALMGLLASEEIFISALVAGALSVDAARASDTPFDERIQFIRGHAAQIKVASLLRELLQQSEIRDSHQQCHKIQDPYSLRCQPQVMGACLSHMHYISEVLLTEANAVSDNPLVFIEQNAVLSGGNFHAEPVALVADALAVSLAEIGALSERRIALLVDPHFSGLPAFLVNNPGVNSGFMIAQVTAAALASENKSLAHPASVDSLPTSANQEDHVSMATYAARRLLPMAENTATIVGIELLAACQGIDFLRPLKSSPQLERIHTLVRQHVDTYDKDRYFAPDIQKIKWLIQSGKIRKQIDLTIFRK
ncbi:histidine ammonia-lyase [Aquicella lusitana]|uniref:Histidine ammonia-lyase n=1 Tax=Aquicella lusitana TaxID=254246 RepID=A0A370GJF3_9COXI|nr:histidine ammonia-lyase [Aquicella lusitana]RDI43791.1 histidine ammonia-lyase [Aquicella lusitana]VVC74478.1 Histidine ammonia-lyase [Aquicella lusitana]